MIQAPGDLRGTDSALAGRRVLVTGATGAIGGPVVQALAAAGADVHALVRRPPATLASSPLHGAARLHVGDLTDATAVRAALDGMDVVVHLAALLHVVDPPPALVPEYTRINDTATAALMTACRTAGVSRVIYTSTIAVYGEARPADGLITEDWPCRPLTAYGRSKLAGEAHVLAARDAAGRPMGVVLRLAAVYGAGIKGNYRRLLDALARGRYVAIGRGDNRRTLVHEADVARAVVRALAAPAAGGRVYNVTDGCPHPMRAIVAAMCEALGRPAPRVRVPLALARVGIAALAVGGAVLRRRPPLTRAALHTLLEDVAVDGTRARVELGLPPAIDLIDGWREVVARLRAAGDLPPR